MFDKVLNNLKYSSKEELDKNLIRENEVPIIVFQEICRLGNLDTEKTENIQLRFSNSYFYANATSWFNDVAKIGEKNIFIENGKKMSYESETLNELVIYFIKYNMDPKVDETEVRYFLKGFIFNAIQNLLKKFVKEDRNLNE
mgnify:FL=1